MQPRARCQMSVAMLLKAAAIFVVEALRTVHAFKSETDKYDYFLSPIQPGHLQGGLSHENIGVILASLDGTNYKCSLSLWRVVRGGKLMHLELIHGLFTT
jgi:hypothetical protein